MSSLTVSMAGCGTADQLAPPVPSDDAVRIVWHRLVRTDPGTAMEEVAVEGAIEPIDETDVGYVEVIVTFRDEDADELDRITGSVEAVNEHPWDFRVLYPYTGSRAARVADYDVTVGTVL